MRTTLLKKILYVANWIHFALPPPLQKKANLIYKTSTHNLWSTNLPHKFGKKKRRTTTIKVGKSKTLSKVQMNWWFDNLAEFQNETNVQKPPSPSRKNPLKS
jgi:hypothetical protein